jgi:hypothetical protein
MADAGAGSSGYESVDAVGSVQPLVASWSRRTADLTFDKTDEKDAVLIGELPAQLRCCVPSRSMRPGRACGSGLAANR